jgi:histidyl-tRNA synthetase
VGDIVAGKQVPAVGVSLGMERVFAIMEEQEKEKNQVYSSMPLPISIESLSSWNSGLKF